jgi:hypothetical protein
LVSICWRNCFGLIFFEEAGVEVAGVVDQHIDTPEPVDRGLADSLCSTGVGDVEGHRKQVLLLAQDIRHLLRVPRGRHHSVAGSQSRLDDVDTHTRAAPVTNQTFMSLILLCLSIDCLPVKPGTSR